MLVIVCVFGWWLMLGDMLVVGWEVLFCVGLMYSWLGIVVVVCCFSVFELSCDFVWFVVLGGCFGWWCLLIVCCGYWVFLWWMVGVCCWVFGYLLVRVLLFVLDSWGVLLFWWWVLCCVNWIVVWFCWLCCWGWGWCCLIGRVVGWELLYSCGGWFGFLSSW